MTVGPDGRELFLASGRPDSALPWATSRLGLPADALPSEVVACAASQTAVYLALREHGLRRVDLAWESHRPEGWRARLGPAVRLDGPAGPLGFVALAVGPVLAGEPTTWEALYAVVRC